MMKQPAENTNATRKEEEEALRRAQPPPVFSAEDEAEIHRLAREEARREEAPSPSPRHVERAREIIRNRKLSLQKP